MIWNSSFDNFIDCVDYRNRLRKEIFEPLNKKLKQENKSIYYSCHIKIEETKTRFLAILTTSKEEYDIFEDAKGNKRTDKENCCEGE